MDTNVLEEKTNNYLASIYMDEKGIGFSYVDMSTGEIYTTEYLSSMVNSYQFAIDELGRLLPKEIIVNDIFLKDKKTLKFVENRVNPFINSYKESLEDIDSLELINRHFKEDVYLKKNSHSTKSLYKILDYLYSTQHKNLEHISHLNQYNKDEYMTLDINAISNLEIKETILNRDKKGSLLWTLDKTSTAMGGRLLKSWIENHF